MWHNKIYGWEGDRDVPKHLEINHHHKEAERPLVVAPVHLGRRRNQEGYAIGGQEVLWWKKSYNC